MGYIEDIYEEAMVALLAGLTTENNERIFWQDNLNNKIQIKKLGENSYRFIGYEDGKYKDKLFSEEYKDEKLNGCSKEFYRNGVVSRKVEYKDDKKNGIERLYYASGNIEMEVLYEDGRFIRSKIFDARGNLIVEKTKKEY